jgi:transcriptional regulator GlxA family with amidase domain
LQRAKRILDTTDLPMPEVALAAGFSSLRRFNAVVFEVYGRPPTELRRIRATGGPCRDAA